ncbi:PAS domain-containing protein [Pedobacter cryophilus]|nr:PAS domain S-box protein [Pedobacter cryophilus]
MKDTHQYVKNSEILYFCVTDLDGNYTYVSPHFAKIFNFTPKQLYGTSSLLTIYVDDHPKCFETVAKCFEQPNTYQKVLLRKPLNLGKLVWTQWEFYLATDEQNNPSEMICYGYDISHKIESLNLLKSAHKKFIESETKYKTLFETSSLGILLHTPNGDLYDANETFCKMIGINKADVTHHNIIEFTPPEYWESDKAFINDLIVNDNTYSYEKEFKTKDNETIPVSINGKIFHDQSGKLFIWCIAKDITERKKSRELLQHQRELLEETSQIAKLGGWTININTFKTEWTKEVYEIHDLEEPYDHDLAISISYYHTDDRETITNAVNETINEGKKFDLELRFISAKNINKWVRVAGEPVYKDGKLISVKGILQDITEKKNTENIISKQNNLLKDISFTQSHLIRLPVANLLGLTDLLEMTDNEEERLDICKKIRYSVFQLDKIVKEVANKKIED